MNQDFQYLSIVMESVLQYLLWIFPVRYIPLLCDSRHINGSKVYPNQYIYCIQRFCHNGCSFLCLFVYVSDIHK